MHEPKDRARRRFMESLPEIQSRIAARRDAGWPTIEDCTCSHNPDHPAGLDRACPTHGGES
jgi:hypothetical protein